MGNKDGENKVKTSDVINALNSFYTKLGKRVNTSVEKRKDGDLTNGEEANFVRMQEIVMENGKPVKQDIPIRTGDLRASLSDVLDKKLNAPKDVDEKEEQDEMRGPTLH
jgi:hypothetical protein